MWKDRSEITGASYDKSTIIEEAAKFNILPSILAILKKRNVGNIEDYLYPSYETFTSCDLYMAREGADLIRNEIMSNNLITIIGDYDVDGATSSTIMKKVIEDCGGRAEILIPDRFIDGYGISERLINMAYESNSRFIITVDNGISAVEQIKYAKSLGFRIVLTDHHDIKYSVKDEKTVYTIPDADVVINPKYPGHNYHQKDICGAMVAYKIARLLIRDMISDSDYRNTLDNYYKVLAGLGTVCDVMPLTAENRHIVKQTLSLLSDNSPVVGINSLLDSCGVSPSGISSFTLGFVIGPCINAEGRLTGNLHDSISLLLCNNKQVTSTIADSLKKLNDERKLHCKRAEDIADEMMDDTQDSSNNIILLYIPDILESVCGIVAGRVKEKYSRPCIVATNTSSGLLKGSGRSVEGYNLFENLNKYNYLFEKVGGHSLAVGLSITEDNYNILNKKLNEDSLSMDQDIFTNSIVPIDLFMPMSKVNDRFVEELSLLEPFGEGNEKPSLCSENVILYHLKPIGANNNALKFYFIDNGRKIEAIYFGNLEFIYKKLHSMMDDKTFTGLHNSTLETVHMDCIYYPSFNTWNNVKSIQFILSDIKLSDLEMV